MFREGHPRRYPRCRTRRGREGPAQPDNRHRQQQPLSAGATVGSSHGWRHWARSPARTTRLRPVLAPSARPRRGKPRRVLSPTFGPLMRCRGVGAITSGSAQILVDESGRRRRVLRWSGRAVSVALLLWLGLLALGALGLQPLGRLPVLGQSQPRPAPPVLPARIEAAAARSTAHRPESRGAAVSATLGATTSRRPDASRAGKRTSRPTRDRPAPAAGTSTPSPPARPGTSATPFQPPATTPPSTPPSTGTTPAPPSASTGVKPGPTGAEHGNSTSSPGLTDTSPGQVKPDGAPASPPVPTDPGQSAEHPPQGRDQTPTIPKP
jgi:hypothetical protein